MKESYPNRLKTLWEKQELLVTSNFPFSHSVFKRLVSLGRQKVSMCGNGLSEMKRSYGLDMKVFDLVVKAFAEKHKNLAQKFKFIFGSVESIAEK